ncbi:Trans-acting enoyl reductase [Nostocoides japonicum T1-X7]|uniref:Trans-acting enoyl reductase n=1 Tax=Nostocoides japonicum T1-X7 TaxID=1194083 RepID=A0A077M8V0_9MICO|nr:saccharopine dehydrogenase NADP-binding domain-containing protein [Tetrasphaera japonica]CCH80445.1 Trans-acting enoyl reductase [Tetrasphaera japonica T1-X7]
MAAPRGRDLDIVLYGASGFVGRLTAEYLAQHAPPDARIALAGRSESKVHAVRDTLGGAASGWPIIVADASDTDALAALASRTRTVATTVGPYLAYGMPLASACAAAGTHYADLTGEVLFVRRSIDANHEAAVSSGARIVHSCGFDSVPSDLGVLVLAERIAADGEGTLGTTTLSVRSLRGGFSGGTVDSMRRQAIATGSDPAARRIVADPYALSPDRAAEPTADDDADRARRFMPVRQDRRGHWTAPFVMAAYNTRIVRRSNALSGYAYGRDFRYDEVTDCGPGIAEAAQATAMASALAGLAAGMSFAPTRALLDRFLPAPGEGPDVERGGRFVLDIETTTSTDARYRARVAADKDPGYGGTAVMLGESALALALDDLPAAAGVLTPATGIGPGLADRLRAQGFTIEVDRR